MGVFTQFIVFSLIVGVCFISNQNHINICILILKSVNIFFYQNKLKHILLSISQAQKRSTTFGIVSRRYLKRYRQYLVTILRIACAKTFGALTSDLINFSYMLYKCYLVKKILSVFNIIIIYKHEQ